MNGGKGARGSVLLLLASASAGAGAALGCGGKATRAEAGSGAGGSPWVTTLGGQTGSGGDGAGQLGLGDLDSRGWDPDHMGDQLPVLDLGTGRTAVMLAAGNEYACALLDDGTVRCWGAGSPGSVLVIGDEPGEMGDALAPVAWGSGRMALSIVSRGWRSCALLDGDSVYCWEGLSE